MDNHSNSIGKEQEDPDGSPVSLSRLWQFVQRRWLFFLVSGLLCWVASQVFLHFSSPRYDVMAKVLIRGQEQRGEPLASGRAPSSLEGMNRGNGIGNELEILRTKTLSKRVVRSLRLYTTYHVGKGLKSEEIYGKESPYLVDIQEDMLDSLSCPLRIVMSQGEDVVEVEMETEDFSQKQFIKSFPANVSTPFGTLLFAENPYGKMAYMEQGLEMVMKPVDEVAGDYASSLTVKAVPNAEDIAVLTFTDNLPNRSSDFLRKLVEAYNEDAALENNIEAVRTRDFIDERLSDISKDFNVTDAELRQFKSNSGMMRYKSDGTVDATRNVLHEQRLVEVSTQIDLINYLIEYCNDKHNEWQIVPSNIGLNNDNINLLVNKYNEAILKRNQLIESSSADSPSVDVVSNEAESHFTALKSSLQVVKNQAVMQRNELLSQQRNTGGQGSTSRGRMLADINRLQEVKAGLYLMLLQKREENLLSLSAAPEKARLIEEPTVVGGGKPNKVLVGVCAFIVGLLLPFAGLLLKK